MSLPPNMVANPKGLASGTQSSAYMPSGCFRLQLFSPVRQGNLNPLTIWLALYDGAGLIVGYHNECCNRFS